MAKEYKLERANDLEDLLSNMNTDMRETFKLQMFKMNREAFTNLAQCYKSTSVTIKDSDKCVSDNYQKMSHYERRMQAAWNNSIVKLKSCVSKCKQDDSICLSACANSTAKAIYEEFKDIHNFII